MSGKSSSKPSAESHHGSRPSDALLLNSTEYRASSAGVSLAFKAHFLASTYYSFGRWWHSSIQNPLDGSAGRVGYAGTETGAGNR